MDNREDRNMRGRYDDAGSGQRHSGDYDDEEPKPQKITRKQALTLVGLIIVISLFVSMLWGNYSLVSKTNYGTDITGIVDDIGKLQNAISSIQDVSGTVNTLNNQLGNISDKLNALNNDIANLKTSQGNYATKDALAQANTNLTNIQNTLNNLQTQVNNTKQINTSGITASIDTLNAQVSSLEDRIKSLEDKAVTPPLSASAVVATVKTISNTLIATSNTTLNGSIRIEIKNTSSVAVSDIVLDILIQTSMISGASTASLSGGGTVWQGMGTPYNMMEFMNTQWGLNLAANETKTLYLTYTVAGSGFNIYQTTGVPFQVNVDVF